MRATNMNLHLQAVMEEGVRLSNDNSIRMRNPLRILQTALAALSDGRLSAVVEHFDDCFTFKDHALTLEFTDKQRLLEFFEKSRELFMWRTEESFNGRTTTMKPRLAESIWPRFSRSGLSTERRIQVFQFQHSYCDRQERLTSITLHKTSRLFSGGGIVAKNVLG